MEEKVRKFGLFDNENNQMNYNNLAGRSIHSGDVVDWDFLSNKGWRVGLYSERESRDVATLSGLRGAEIVNSTHLTHLFWPSIGDDRFNVGNTKVKCIRNPRIKLAHQCITMTIAGRKETTNRVTEIDLFYLYCIFGEGVVCNIPYWLAKYLKSVKDKSVIFGGMFLTRIDRSFGLLTNEMGECCWPTTKEVMEEGEGDDEEGDKEGGNKGVGGSADIYRNMSQGDCQSIFSLCYLFRNLFSSTTIRDENPICTLGDYSKPSHEGYRNTIELLVGNNVVPLRSDTIRLVQNGCSFHGLRFEDPNQHIKDFLKLMDSLDLDGSITTWEDLTTRFLAQFFPPRRTAKLCNDILMFQQHHGKSLSEAWTRLRTYYKKSFIMASTFGSKSKFFMTMSIPSQDEPWNNRPALENALLDFDSNQKKRLYHLRTQLEQQQDDMIGKINLLWKTVFEKLNDVSTLKNAGNSMVYKSNAARHDEREELRKKGIKSPSKLFSQKYLSPASIKELNKNPSAPKCVHFVNSIVILSTDSDTEEEDISSTNAHKHELGNMVRRGGEVKGQGNEQGKEEDEMETDVEVEEVIEEEESKFETDEEVEEIFEEDEDDENFNSFPTMKELSHHEWLLKNPRPPWVKAKIRARSLNNIKISFMIGHFFKRHAYIELESPINIMSRHQYNQIMTYELRSRQKPSNPDKISNFVGRVRRLKFFIKSFTYECDFMILEDTTTIIDRHLGEMVFRKRPFIIKPTGLVYNKEEGTVMFEQDDENITFKMPHTWRYSSKQDLWV
ncbi:MAK10-like protein [Tanacetum coccineum]